MSSFGCSFRDLVGREIDQYVDHLRRLTGFDVSRSPHFWETWIALQIGGEQTEHKGEVDVEVVIWGRRYCAEVKFSRAFWSKYNGIRGKDWSRNVFKWSISIPQDVKRRADVLILIGVDTDGAIYSWVVPFNEIKKGRRSLTITAPSSRSDNALGRLDRWNVPPTEMLPAFARACHNRYDAPMRAAGIKERSKAKRAVGDLFA